MPCHLNETQRFQNEEMKSHGFKNEMRRNPSVKKATQCKSHIHDHSLPSFHLSKNRKKPEKKETKGNKKKARGCGRKPNADLSERFPW
jgi:hypothetical protein